MITFDNDILSFSHIGGQDYASWTTSNPCNNYRVSTEADWITVEIQHSEMDLGDLFIQVENNTKSQNRTAVITLTGYDIVEHHDVEANLVIEQQAEQTVGAIDIKNIRVDGYVVENVVVSYEQHSLIFDVNTRLIEDLQISSSGNFVNLYSQVKNGDVYTYTYNIEENTVTDNRTAVITLTATDVNLSIITKELSITQNGKQLHPIVFNTDNDDVYLNSRQQLLEVNITKENVSSWDVDSYPEWLTIATITDNKVTYLVDENVTPLNREDEIIYEVNGVDGDVILYTTKIAQQHAVIQAEIPTWQDYSLVIPKLDETSSYYNIYTGEGEDYKLIYSGHSYSLSDEPNEINITEIVRNYVKNDTNMARLNFLHKTAYEKFDVYAEREEGMDLIASLSYYYDYSFELDEDQENWYIRNKPLKKYLDPRQFLPIGIFNHYGDKKSIIIQNDTMFGSIIQVQDNGIFNYNYVIPNGATYVNVKFAGDEIKYDVKDTCSKAVLYYLNPFGAWDSLLFEGRFSKTVGYEKNTILHDFNNTTKEFGNEHYLKNIKTTYKGTTGYITDEESSRITYVLQSTKAYLHIFDENVFIPILINNTNVEIKTYRNNNRKLYTYSIELEESQNKFSK